MNYSLGLLDGTAKNVFEIGLKPLITLDKGELKVLLFAELIVVV